MVGGAGGEEGSDFENHDAVDADLEEQEALIAGALQDMGIDDHEPDHEEALSEGEAREVLLSQYERVRKEIRDKKNARGFSRGAGAAATSATRTGTGSKVESFRVDIQEPKKRTPACLTVGRPSLLTT